MDRILSDEIHHDRTTTEFTGRYQDELNDLKEEIWHMVMPWEHFIDLKVTGSIPFNQKSMEAVRETLNDIDELIRQEYGLIHNDPFFGANQIWEIIWENTAW